MEDKKEKILGNVLKNISLTQSILSRYTYEEVRTKIGQQVWDKLSNTFNNLKNLN